MSNLSNYEPCPAEVELLNDFERITSQNLVERNALIYVTRYVALRKLNKEIVQNNIAKKGRKKLYRLCNKENIG
ncbi:hypothetical protein ALC57_16066 [Trachymyrmex cornetzi]|uniref:Uncharacterized protein n=1 Tax=Trachymyrmex cornetzi TaxID=471704 RepID=A0A151IVS1_9HYME|nr:hypothetical protein ALC57_16066 [Trachymyrmex cornetzi]